MSTIYEDISASLTIISAELSKLANYSRGLSNRVESAEANALPPLKDRIVAVLSHPDYALRTTQAVVDSVQVDRDAVFHSLDASGIDFVVRRRQRDGAEMIGLASRQ